jgi:hypothetical protein
MELPRFQSWLESVKMAKKSPGTSSDLRVGGSNPSGRATQKQSRVELDAVIALTAHTKSTDAPSSLWFNRPLIKSQGGEAMPLVVWISLLVMPVSVLGCASQIERAQTSQLVAEQAKEEQPKKPAMPTFTYRPGW